MKAKSIQCPGCGKTAVGKFCSHCGAPITTTCPSCEADVEPGTRICNECGVSLLPPAPPTQWNAQTLAPWLALGVASIALIVALVALLSRSGNSTAGPEPLSAPLTSAAPASGQPVDLASMTPRQAADRLFNRIMTANENGNTAEALRFAPMGLQAYDNLETLDNDARYHVALIHLTTGDIKNARAQIDKLRQSAPNHLLAIMLEHQIAERSGNKTDAARAYRAFLIAYNSEIETKRAEYEEHNSGIERFHKAAEAAMAAKK